jgi:uncharacterized membrane protein YphA (DoxX/SURF4 family)
LVLTADIAASTNAHRRPKYIANQQRRRFGGLMHIATTIVSSLLALVLVGSAGAKLTKAPQVVDTVKTVEFPLDKLWLLAAAEIAGGIGLVIGLFWWPIGIAAAVGVILYFIGAVGAHLRVKDRNFGPALVLLVVAVVALVLRWLTI